MKGKNNELIIKNVWNGQTSAEKSKDNFLELRLVCGPVWVSIREVSF